MGIFKLEGRAPATMAITWNEIVAIYLSQPWWVWQLGIVAVWLGSKGLVHAVRAYAESPVISDRGFRQCRVDVDYRAGTIRLPRGDTFPVSRVRGLRWENYRRSGFYQAVIEIDDIRPPLHPVVFSTPDGPAEFVSRLRSAIERAGGHGTRR